VNIHLKKLEPTRNQSLDKKILTLPIAPFSGLGTCVCVIEIHIFTPVEMNLAWIIRVPGRGVD
jgi:hypothetical protein